MDQILADKQTKLKEASSTTEAVAILLPKAVHQKILIKIKLIKPSLLQLFDELRKKADIEKERGRRVWTSLVSSITFKVKVINFVNLLHQSKIT